MGRPWLEQRPDPAVARVTTVLAPMVGIAAAAVSPHAIPAPAMSFPFLPLPPFTSSPVPLHPLFSAAFVRDLFYPLSYLHSCFVFVTFVTFLFFFFLITDSIISPFCFSFHLCPCVSLFLAFAHIFKFFLISISLSYPLLSVVLALPPLRLHPSSPSTSRL